MHGLSFVYIGYSIIYGKRTIKWADNLFNYYFNNAKNPNEFKVKEKNKLKYQWQEFKRICLCSLIILSFLLLGIYLSGFEHSFWFIYWFFSSGFSRVFFSHFFPKSFKSVVRFFGVFVFHHFTPFTAFIHLILAIILAIKHLKRVYFPNIFQFFLYNKSN